MKRPLLPLLLAIFCAATPTGADVLGSAPGLETPDAYTLVAGKNLLSDCPARLDDGEQDDKLIAVPAAGAFSQVKDLASLRGSFLNAAEISELWFSSYKGPGEMESKGWADAPEAMKVLDAAAAAFEAAPGRQ